MRFTGGPLDGEEIGVDWSNPYAACHYVYRTADGQLHLYELNAYAGSDRYDYKGSPDWEWGQVIAHLQDMGVDTIHAEQRCYCTPICTKEEWESASRSLPVRLFRLRRWLKGLFVAKDKRD